MLNIILLVLMLVGCDFGAQVSDANGGGKDKASGALVVPGTNQGDIQLNTAAPDFTLNDANGKPVNLLTVAHAHKLTVVNFWASWCPPCRAEMPDLADVYAKYKGKGLEIIGVNDQESADQVRQYASDGGYNWPLVLTTNGDVITAYRAGSLPNTYFVDDKGIIVHVVRGAMNHAELVSTLAQYGFNSSASNFTLSDAIGKLVNLLTVLAQYGFNSSASNFTLSDVNGKLVNLLTVAHAHKLTLVNFWASWCPPCRAEMTNLATVYNKYKGQGLEILGINDQESDSQIRQYARDGGYTWPLLLTTNTDLISAYQATALPSVYFVDDKGIIVHVVRGAMNHAELVSTLAKYGFN